MLSDIEQRFQTTLVSAIVGGSLPAHSSGLGPQTLAALTLVATEHPDATADIIAAAYDAFRREHS